VVQETKKKKTSKKKVCVKINFMSLRKTRKKKDGAIEKQKPKNKRRTKTKKHSSKSKTNRIF